MRASLILTCCLSMFVVSRGAELPIIRSITIHGNHVFSENDLLGLMVLQRGDRYSMMQLARYIHALQDHYAQSGYFFSEVTGDSSRMNRDSSAIDIVLNINEGMQVSI